MKHRKPYRYYLLILCLFLSGMFFGMPVYADTGPKPSVDITITGIGSQTCYGTLLSKEKSTGPASVWDGTGEPYTGEGGKEIWSKFQAYTDADGFYFLNWNWAVSDAKSLHWGYYPPEEFKVLLYFPESDSFVTSGILERYAFSSYYSMAVPAAAEKQTVTTINAVKKYNFLFETMSFTIRVLLTIGIELAVAWFFGYRRRKQMILLLKLNLVTQILLNAVLNVLVYSMSATYYSSGYCLLEVLVCGIEMFVDYKYLSAYGDGHPARDRAIYYAIAANLISFFLGGWIVTRWFG
jgi:hypothetical protein